MTFSFVHHLILTSALLWTLLASHFSEPVSKDLLGPPKLITEPFANRILTRSPVTKEQRHKVLWLTMVEQKKQQDQTKTAITKAKDSYKNTDRAMDSVMYENKRGSHRNDQLKRMNEAMTRMLADRSRYQKAEQDAVVRLESIYSFFDKTKLLNRRTRMQTHGVLMPKRFGPSTIRRLQRSKSTPALSRIRRPNLKGESVTKFGRPKGALRRTKSGPGHTDTGRQTSNSDEPQRKCRKISGA